MPYDSGEYEKLMDLALKRADFATFEQRRADSAARGKLRGLGLSYYIEAAVAAQLNSPSCQLTKMGGF